MAGERRVEVRQHPSRHSEPRGQPQQLPARQATRGGGHHVSGLSGPRVQSQGIPRNAGLIGQSSRSVVLPERLGHHAQSKAGSANAHRVAHSESPGSLSTPHGPTCLSYTTTPSHTNLTRYSQYSEYGARSGSSSMAPTTSRNHLKVNVVHHLELDPRSVELLRRAWSQAPAPAPTGFFGPLGARVDRAFGMQDVNITPLLGVWCPK